MQIWRDGKGETLSPVIAVMPEHPERMAQNDTGAAPQDHPQTATTMGLKLSPLTADLRRELSVPKNVKGVVVTLIADASPLAALGLAPGDVIQAVNQEPVAMPKDFIAKLDAVKKSGSKNLLLLINRHGVNQFVALNLANGGNG